MVIIFTLFNARRHLRGNVGMLGVHVWNVPLFPRHFHTIRLLHLHRFFINKVSRDQIIMWGALRGNITIKSQTPSFLFIIIDIEQIWFFFLKHKTAVVIYYLLLNKGPTPGLCFFSKKNNILPNVAEKKVMWFHDVMNILISWIK